MSSPALPFPLTSSDRFHGVGDSLVDTPGLLGGFMDYVRMLIHARQSVLRSGGTASRVTTGSRTTATTLMTVTKDGIGGTGISNLYTNRATRVAAYNPTALLWLVSINDAAGGGTTWRTGLSGNNADAFATYLDSTFPTMKVLVLGILCNGEKWTTASGWGSNAQDALILDMNTTASSLASAHGYYYMDIRGSTIADSNTILNYESTHNTPEPGSATYLTDSLHPSVLSASPSGQKVVGQMIYDRMSVT